MSEFNKSLMDEILLEVMKLEGVDTYIYHINGKVTIAALVEIENQLLEYEQELLDQGDGYYKLSCCWNTGEFTPLCELYINGPESEKKYIPNHGEYTTNLVQGWSDLC